MKPGITRCPKGHEYTEDNTLIYDRKRPLKDGTIRIYPTRTCKTCTRDRVRKSRFKDLDASREYHRDYSRRVRDEAIEAYGGNCVCCGETTREFLHLDHVNNDGSTHRQEVGTGSHKMALWAKRNNWPDTLQLLCHNCGMSDAYYGYCPHQQGGGPN